MRRSLPQKASIPSWLTAGVALAVGVGACSLVVDNSTEQCTSDADCAKFNTTCDLTTNLCIDPGSGTGGQGGGTGGQGGNTGGGGGTGDPCDDPDKPVITIEGDITSDASWTCDRDYMLKGRVYVTDGVTLSIQAGTKIMGKFAANELEAAVLVVQPGGMINAVGTADRPIVFTSELEPQFREAGDWGGVIILGRARVNEPSPTIEGITAGGEYGGTEDDDDSGILRYARIEYSGTIIGANNEINGLTFGGVGSGTQIDHIQVRHTLDDCFEFFGGTVNAHHLVCQHNEDDGIDWDLGYRGKLQFVVVQQKPNTNEDMHGIEADNSSETALPVSSPTLYNITLIGNNQALSSVQYGMVLKEWTDATIHNTLVMGFDYGWDVRDEGAGITLANSIFFGQVLDDIAEDETSADDDGGFDEVAVFNANDNTTADPGIPIGDATNPLEFLLGPPAALTDNSVPPPDDGFFDPTANYVGAVEDANDTWVTDGSWVVWDNH